MAIIDDRTPARGYKLPAPTNNLSDDVERLRETIDAVSADVAALLEGLAGKAAFVHGHGMVAITGLADALAGKLPADWRPALDDLTDVSVAEAANRMLLMRIGASWQASRLVLGDIEGWESTVTAIAAAAVASAITGLKVDAPAVLDTFGELAAALGNDPNYAATISAMLGNRLRIDAAQGLNGTQKAQGLTNLGVTSAAQALLVLADAATIFAAIKQAATDATTGVVELATPAEAAAGVDTGRAVTPAGVAAAIAALTTPGLGVGQTVKSVTRSIGTLYQNATGRTIHVHALYSGQSGTALVMQWSASGAAWVDGPTAPTSGERTYCSLPIPPNTYYRFVRSIGVTGGAIVQVLEVSE